ncbi:hypothetical protein [Telmatospirillum sp.]|uniref:hypothetical protein n=1 Tax=Telmatospirillum sp. TaxID=2079197 RepID=UPI00283BCBC0|nr:hypothetical protein [Telmatospirillum sp.]MDR3437498.1 hypothetical protein [Telmatospirillum sp.]
MASKTDIVIGDRFRKVGSFQMPAWTVARISCANDKLPHAHLEKDGNPNDSITVGLLALTDSTLYRKVPDTVDAENGPVSHH